MKQILLALTMVSFLLQLAPRVEADTEVSLNFFYDNLSPYGSWIDVAGYGYCFQPSVAVDNTDWRDGFLGVVRGKSAASTHLGRCEHRSASA